MKSQAELLAWLRTCRANPILCNKRVTVLENPRLALEQLELETTIYTLQSVLRVPFGASYKELEKI